MTTIIDAPKALELLRAVTDERGAEYEYQYEPNTERCLYWHKKANACGCMVGAALFKAGVTTEHLIGLDDHDNGTSAISLPHRDLGDFAVTEDAAEVFGAAQRAQDGGKPWGFALDRAEQEIVRQAELRVQYRD